MHVPVIRLPHILTGMMLTLTAATAWLIISSWEFVVMMFRSLLGQPLATCGCEVLFSWSNHPILFSLLLITLVFISASLMKGIALSFSSWLHTRKATRDLLTKTAAVEYIPSTFRMVPVHIITHDTPIVFVSGILVPKILMSHIVHQSLTPEERRAVIAHEAAHISAGHMLKKILFFGFLATLPAKASLRSRVMQQIELLQELYADEHSAKYTSTQTLLSATLKVHEIQQQFRSSFQPLALSAAFGLLERRIAILVHGGHATIHEDKTLLTRPLFVFSGVLILLLFGLSTPALAERGVAADRGTAAACIQQQQALMSAEKQSHNLQIQSQGFPELTTQCTIQSPVVDPISEINYSK